MGSDDGYFYKSAACSFNCSMPPKTVPRVAIRLPVFQGKSQDKIRRFWGGRMSFSGFTRTLAGRAGSGIC